MRILFLTQWFDPEPAFKGLAFAKALRERGHEVEVATGFPNYPSGVLYPGYRLRLRWRETMDGIPVRRLPLYPSHDGSAVRRSLNYLSFFVSALFYCLVRARRYDVIYVYHPPITVGLAAALSGLVRGTPYVLDIQDLWPDSVAATGMARGRTVRVLEGICRFVHRRAAGIIAQSHGIRDQLIARGVAAECCTVVYNWADEGAARSTIDAGDSPAFTIVYAGNLGKAQALHAVVEAATRAVRDAPDLEIVLIGGGTEVESLAALKEKLGADAVTILPPVPRDALGEVLGRADALLVHLADDPLFRITIPSKTQFYLAAGKPILAGLAGEAAEMIVAADGGIVVPPEDTAALAAAMVRMSRLDRAELDRMGANGRAYYEQNLAFDQGIAATLTVLGRVTGGMIC